MTTVQEQPRPNAAEMDSHFRGSAPDYSLVMGGPLFQLFRKAHLGGTGMELLYRRIFTITAIAWLPLLLLSTARILSGGTGGNSFFTDVEVHVRFLVALPLLIVAEVIVHKRLTPVVSRFVERRIILPQDLPRFEQAIESAIRLRNSVRVEIALLILVYTVGLWLWHGRIAFDAATWYAMPGGRWHLTPAGYWYVFISIPIAQFVLLRWYLRLFIWFRFLWQVSRINLNLIPTHPDRCAGLAFLGRTSYAFGPLLCAQGAMLAGVMASRVLYGGQSLVSFKLQIGGVIAFFVFAIVIPLVVFTPQMARAKRKGLAEYGQLAQEYVERFDRKWVRHDAESSEDLLGTGDIQSLADLGNSYGVISEMRTVPFKLGDLTRLAAATAAPFVPLLLTVWSPEELILRILKLVF